MIHYIFKATLITSLFLGLSALPSQATLLGYWNMDGTPTSNKMPANDGTQKNTLGASNVFVSLGFATLSPNVSGSTINLYGDAPETNRALGFTDLASAGLAFSFRMDNVNLQNYEDVELTFAIQNYTLAIASAFEVQARIGDEGSWVDYAESISGSDSYQLASINFNGDLDHVSDPVDFRIRYNSLGSAISYLDIDNVQINAVPEPQTYALFFGASVLGFVMIRRRLKKSA